MSKSFIICLVVLQSLVFSLKAQEPTKSETDSSAVKTKQIETDVLSSSIVNDTVAWMEADKEIDLRKNKAFSVDDFKPNPKKAVIYSVIFPGLGQIYNRKYWKLPIIYGGFVGLSYAISWNGRYYNDYSKAYKDLVTGEGTSWQDLLGVTSLNGSNLSQDQLEASLKRKRNFFRRNRDLAIIATVGLYALCIIDAYVDAQLFDFDISPDLSMRVDPVIWGPSQFSKTTVGLQCSVKF